LKCSAFFTSEDAEDAEEYSVIPSAARERRPVARNMPSLLRSLRSLRMTEEGKPSATSATSAVNTKRQLP